MAFFEVAPKVLLGMEACPGSQWLARRLAAMGHDARIIPSRFVKPYVKSNKTDKPRAKNGPRSRATNLEPEGRISSRPCRQKRLTDQRPDTFTQAGASSTKTLQ
jgi:transposase